MNTKHAPARPAIDELRRLGPVEFLDAGHVPGDIFSDERLEFLAEEAITGRLSQTPAQRARTRSVADELLQEALTDPILTADAEHMALRRWCAAICADDALAGRVAVTLPAAIRAQAEEVADRWLHRIVFSPRHATGDDRCRSCGLIIAGPFVHIADRMCDDDPGEVCLPCFGRATAAATHADTGTKSSVETTRGISEYCVEMTREMERIKGILIAQAGAGATARDRPTPDMSPQH